jgi:alanyl-tRNA synthetase
VVRLETRANEIVAQCHPVRGYYPDAAALAAMEYRAKLTLTENVRIVEITDVDLCACCAPHVKRTGEVGLIKILSHQSHRGGTRLLLKCGFDALEDYCSRCASISAISASLCAKENEVADAVERLKEEKAKLDYQIEQLNKEKTLKYIKKFKTTDSNVCVFTDDLDADGLRETVNAGKLLCSGIVGVFVQAENGYKYCLGSNTVNLSAFAKQFNAALGGRGGGKPEMIQGSVTASKKEILEFLSAEEV